MNANIKTIVIGTFNRDKMKEVKVLLAHVPVEIRDLSAFPRVVPVEEDGTTFLENARKKATGLARQIGLTVLAEDSGLEVDALGGRPGVMSARYAGPGAGDAQLVAKVLSEMAGVSTRRRTGRFRCAAVLATPDRVLIETQGSVEGRLSWEPRGTFGFGYDPVFIPRSYEMTFAELGPRVKHAISHRARALTAFREHLLHLMGIEADQ